MDTRNFELADPPPGFADDPFPWYATLRARSPVHGLSDGSWLLTRHADCAAVYRDARFRSDKTELFRPKLGDSLLYDHHTTNLIGNGIHMIQSFERPRHPPFTIYPRNPP